MKYAIIEKARPHKYIKRTGMPGKYEYFYEEQKPQMSEQDKLEYELALRGGKAYAQTGKMSSIKKEMKIARAEAEIEQKLGVQPQPQRSLKDFFEPEFEHVKEEGGEYNPAKQIELQFRDLAAKKGYTKKVVGDYAYQTKKGNTIRLKGGKGGNLQIWEEGVGYYEVPGTVHKVELSKEEQIDAFVEKLESGEFKVGGATVANPAKYLKSKISIIKNDIKTWESGPHDKALVDELKERLEGYEEVLRRISIEKSVDSDIKPGVAARLVTEDGYKVWAAFPERTRPIRSYSEDVKESEKELDRIVNELTDSIWDNMKYVVIEKARPHKYIKRTGVPGHFDYFYSEEAKRDAERDIGGVIKPEFTDEEKRLKYHLDRLLEAVEGVHEGKAIPAKGEMLDDRIYNLKSTNEAYRLGKTLSKAEAIRVWEAYKHRIAEPKPKNLKELERAVFVTQMYRETVEGFVGPKGLNAYTHEEIEAKLYPGKK